mmetsp:Transcript_8912/g.21633  ORF Transcript_8912/g.21633 Transcript_8912/m.21633 type:complete len:245 (+) Transcript_8912:379-1113(+)
MIASFFKYMFFGLIVAIVFSMSNIAFLHTLVTSWPFSSLSTLTGTPMGPTTKAKESSNTAVEASMRLLAIASPLGLCATAIRSPALAAVRRCVAVNIPFSDKRNDMSGASERDSGTNSTIQSMQLSGRSCLARAAMIPRLFETMDRIMLTDSMQCFEQGVPPFLHPPKVKPDAHAKTMHRTMIVSLAVKYSRATLSLAELCTAIHSLALIKSSRIRSMIDRRPLHFQAAARDFNMINGSLHRAM